MYTNQSNYDYARRMMQVEGFAPKRPDATKQEQKRAYDVCAEQGNQTVRETLIAGLGEYWGDMVHAGDYDYISPSCVRIQLLSHYYGDGSTEHLMVSNAQTIADELQYSYDYHIRRGDISADYEFSYSGYGWLTVQVLDSTDGESDISPVFSNLVDLLQQMQSYPLLNDELYNELETQANLNAACEVLGLDADNDNDKQIAYDVLFHVAQGMTDTHSDYFWYALESAFECDSPDTLDNGIKPYYKVLCEVVPDRMLSADMLSDMAIQRSRAYGKLSLNASNNDNLYNTKLYKRQARECVQASEAFANMAGFEFWEDIPDNYRVSYNAKTETFVIKYVMFGESVDLDAKLYLALAKVLNPDYFECDCNA